MRTKTCDTDKQPREFRTRIFQNFPGVSIKKVDRSEEPQALKFRKELVDLVRLQARLAGPENEHMSVGGSMAAFHYAAEHDSLKMGPSLERPQLGTMVPYEKLVKKFETAVQAYDESKSRENGVAVDLTEQSGVVDPRFPLQLILASVFAGHYDKRHEFFDRFGTILPEIFSDYEQDVEMACLWGHSKGARHMRGLVQLEERDMEMVNSVLKEARELPNSVLKEARELGGEQKRVGAVVVLVGLAHIEGMRRMLSRQLRDSDSTPDICFEYEEQELGARGFGDDLPDVRADMFRQFANFRRATL